MIEAVGPTERYGGTVAVDGLSFQVRPGSVTGLPGPDGAGKSTAIRMIVGLAAVPVVRHRDARHDNGPVSRGPRKAPQ